MMPIGNRPVLWHIMRYYAHFGHTEFILCLGYGAHVGQGVLPRLPRGALQRLRPDQGGPRHRAARPATSSDWRITFADTGLRYADRGATAPGSAVPRRRRGASWPITATSDRRTDERPHRRFRAARMLSVAASSPAAGLLPCRRMTADDRVSGIEPVADMDMRINGGYFMPPPGDLRLLRRGRGPRHGRVHPGRRGSGSGRRLTVSGHPWTPSRSVRNWRSYIDSAAARGRSGARHRPRCLDRGRQSSGPRSPIRA